MIYRTLQSAYDELERLCPRKPQGWAKQAYDHVFNNTDLEDNEKTRYLIVEGFFKGKEQ